MRYYLAKEITKQYKFKKKGSHKRHISPHLIHAIVTVPGVEGDDDGRVCKERFSVQAIVLMGPEALM